MVFYRVPDCDEGPDAVSYRLQIAKAAAVSMGMIMDTVVPICQLYDHTAALYMPVKYRKIIDKICPGKAKNQRKL